MNAGCFVKALDVTRKLMEHPITRAFHDPVDPEKYPDYFDKITSPQDLCDIAMRLRKGKYNTLQEWEKDIETVWANAEKYYGSGSHITAAAQEGRKLFAKVKRELDTIFIKGWCSEVARLRAKEAQLTSSPPLVIRRAAETVAEFTSFQEGDGNMKALSPKEIDYFMKASEMISDPEVLKEMVKIIAEAQPQLNCKGDEVWIDATKLNFGTIRLLEEHMKKYMQSVGMKYPSDE